MMQNRAAVLSKAFRLEGESLSSFAAELKKLSEAEKDSLAEQAIKEGVA